MLPWGVRRLIPAALGIGVSALASAVVIAPPPWLSELREQTFDGLLQLAPVPSSTEIVVVDIGDANSEGQPWARADTAQLLASIAADNPRVVALDVVLSADCGDTESTQIIQDAVAEVPTTLGFLLVPDGVDAPAPRPPVAVMDGVALPQIWYSAGSEAACSQFQSAAAGAGVLSLTGGDSGRVRFVPAVVAVGGSPYLGLAFDAYRLLGGGSTPVLAGNPPWLRLGTAQFGLGPAGELRIRPSSAEIWASRTVSASEVADGNAELNGKIVLIGSSSPRAGALRPTASSPVQPSVQIHADVLAALLSGRVPERISDAGWIEAGVTLAAGSGLAFAGALAAPVVAMLVIAAALVAWAGTCVALAVSTLRLLDPVLPALGMFLAGGTSLILQAGRLRRAEAALRRRMSQLLPPDVVARFVRDPQLFRLEGEERTVTALFTDIENFAQATRGLPPRAFVGLLDSYFSGMTAIVLRHGGMVDKLVGDALHAFFNAPADVPDHVDAAIRCAVELRHFSEAFCQRPEIVALGLGRTRIGIETGDVILGDVGASGKIDYTAYGDAVNMAARLEASNKHFGSTIAIGPSAAAGSTLPLRSLGTVVLKSFGETEVFTPIE
jgi:adenylate cyclase